MHPWLGDGMDVFSPVPLAGDMGDRGKGIVALKTDAEFKNILCHTEVGNLKLRRNFPEKGDLHLIAADDIDSLLQPGSAADTDGAGLRGSTHT